jgi:hypothetical protein
MTDQLIGEANEFYGPSFKLQLSSTYAALDAGRAVRNQSWILAVAAEGAAYLGALKRGETPPKPVLMRMPMPDLSGPNPVYCLNRFNALYTHPKHQYGDVILYSRAARPRWPAVRLTVRAGQVVRLQNGHRAVIVDTTNRLLGFMVVMELSYIRALQSPPDQPLRLNALRAESVRDAINSEKCLLEEASLAELEAEVQKRQRTSTPSA